jgi:transposase-like protein
MPLAQREVGTPRSYPPELRRKVLDLLKAGRTVSQVAADLQISDQSNLHGTGCRRYTGHTDQRLRHSYAAGCISAPTLRRIEATCNQLRANLSST